MSVVDFSTFNANAMTSGNVALLPSPRFTVEKSYITPLKGDSYTRCLILENGLPNVAVNRFLIKYLLTRKDLGASMTYSLVRFLNEFDSMSLSLSEVSLPEMLIYFEDLYISEAKSYKSILLEINAVASLYEYLAARDYPLDDSVLCNKNREHVFLKTKKDKRKLTLVSSIRDEFLPRYADVDKYLSQSYTKWYSGPQLAAMEDELPSAYRCIFDLTAFCGHRVSTALSVMLSGVDFGQGFVRPTHSKTNLVHTSVLPARVLEQLQLYMFEIRTEIVRKTGSTDSHLFLNKKGQPINYAAYNAALKAAGQRVQAKYPELGLTDVHTHAGRSTFAAALRTYQLEQRRKGLKTISDEDFCLLMDWRTLGSLHNYDLLTRTVEVSPLLTDFYADFFGLASSNQIEVLAPNRKYLKIGGKSDVQD